MPSSNSSLYTLGGVPLTYATHYSGDTYTPPPSAVEKRKKLVNLAVRARQLEEETSKSLGGIGKVDPTPAGDPDSMITDPQMLNVNTVTSFPPPPVVPPEKDPRYSSEPSTFGDIIPLPSREGFDWVDLKGGENNSMRMILIGVAVLIFVMMVVLCVCK